MGKGRFGWDKEAVEEDIRLVNNFIDNCNQLSDSEKLLSAILICHRIRCNMFHGLKDSNATDITGLDAQVDLFRAVNSVLESLVD